MLRCRMTNARSLAVRRRLPVCCLSHVQSLTVINTISKFCINDRVVLLHCNLHLMTSSQSSLSKQVQHLAIKNETNLLGDLIMCERSLASDVGINPFACITRQRCADRNSCPVIAALNLWQPCTCKLIANQQMNLQ